MFKSGKKGIVLFIVLMTVILVIILGNIILGIMFGQNRFTHHKVSRIQAYYASLAGLRYASEMLRQYNLNPSSTACSPASLCSDWIPTDTNPGAGMGTGTTTKCALLCRTSPCTSTLASTLCPSLIGGAPIVDPNLPGAVKAVVIVIGESHSSPDGNTRSIKATVDYEAAQ
jgi:Tfp pilus assembly protein PilX